MARFHKLKVADVRRETEDTVSVAFAVPEELAGGYRFIQGQHLTLRTRIGGEEFRRSYSICSGVNDNELRIAIKKVPGGVFSHYVNEHLRPGHELDVMTPMGRFYTPLNPENRKHYVAFAAGSGITPIMSIAKSALAVEPRSRFTLVYGNRSSSAIIFREELEDLKNRYLGRFSLYHIFSRESQEIELFNGRIDADKCRGLFRSLIRVPAVDEFFVCGPETMINEVSGVLKELGVPESKLHFELFTLIPGQLTRPLARKAPPRAVEGTGERSHVAVIVDGVRTEFDLPYNTDSVLDAALKHGADLPFACKGGVCCTCRARLREGKVDMAVNYALEPAEVEAGFVLTCQSRPLTDRVVVDFDEA